MFRYLGRAVRLVPDQRDCRIGDVGQGWNVLALGFHVVLWRMGVAL